MKKEMSVNETVRESLAIALLHLMKKKDFSKITVSELVKLAGVGRSSFYRNFDSKEELLFSYVTDLYREFFKQEKVPLCASEADRMESFLLPRFCFIKKHREIFKALHDHGMLYEFFNKIEKDLIIILCGQHESTNIYYRAMFSGSCAGIVRCWIKGGFAESEETMVKLFANPPKHF